jgi:hypothetical protein
MTDKQSDNHFASIRFRHNPQNEMLLKALEHVRHFIVQHKLILVGGMAVDAALRLKGTKLYDDDEIPDYDFYSPKNAEHAYLLGSELCKNYPDVDVITAFHTTTMRVRVDGNVVADITYMPPKVFERIRTLEYKGVLIVHPWMVMLDQFRSLSTPYENPPNEVIFERWNKDVKRFNLLHQAYTLGDDMEVVKMPSLHEVRLPKLSEGDALQGWAALAQWETELQAEGALRATATAVHIPVDYCSVVTTEIDRWIGQATDVKFYNQLFSYPRHIRASSTGTLLEVFDFWGERVTLAEGEKQEKPAGFSRVSLHALMFYFMHTWLLRGDPLSLLGVRRTRDLLRLRPTLSITALGTESWSTSTLYGIANIINHDRVKNWKPQTQNFGKNKDGTADCSIRRSFDPTQSPLFAIDESECDGFEPIVPHDRLRLA